MLLVILGLIEPSSTPSPQRSSSFIACFWRQGDEQSIFQEWKQMSFLFPFVRHAYRISSPTADSLLSVYKLLRFSPFVLLYPHKKKISYSISLTRIDVDFKYSIHIRIIEIEIGKTTKNKRKKFETLVLHSRRLGTAYNQADVCT